MAAISSPGIGSGLDINGIITKLMAVEQQPLAVLTQKEASFQAKLSAFGSLKSAVAALESKAFALKSTSLYSGRSASSSDTTVSTASANTAASAGNYTVQTIDLAQANTIASQVFTSLTNDISTVSGKLKIELGTFSGGIYTPDPGRAPVSISIAAGTSSLTDIRDAINTANAGVKASIVNVNSGEYKLTLTSSTTGAKNSIRLSVLDDSDVPVAKNNTDLAKFWYDSEIAPADPGNEFDVTAAAQDARIKVDGVEIFRTGNTISDAITGVTINLLKAGTSTIKVAANSDSVNTAMGAFVAAYNDINAQLRDLTAFDQSTKRGALLLGDAGARGLQASLRGLITGVFAGSGSIRRLADLGVSMLRDGSLEFNSSKLTSALTKNPDLVINAMTATTPGKNGLAVTIASQLKALISEGGLIPGKTGSIESSIKDIDKQRERLGIRLGQIESRYRKQFTALDGLVASMQQTSTYLTQQLATISANNGSN